MVSFKKHFRGAAVLAAASFFFLPAFQAQPMAARRELKKTQTAVSAADAAPGAVEQAGDKPESRLQKSRFLPSLLGLAVAGAVVAVLVLKVFKKDGYHPHVIPLDFVAGVSNPHFPLLAGQTRHYAVAGEAGLEMTVKATANTKSVMGILCLGVQDRVIVDQRFVEDTWRWYAQDRDGNVWYFARETKKYDYEVMTEDWSWLAGSEGAKPGMVMVGHPADHLNKEYRLEYAPGVEEEKALLIGLTETVTVPYGTFSNCLKIKVYSDLVPGRFEFRYYASGIGLVLSETMPGNRRLELAGISSDLPVESRSR